MDDGQRWICGVDEAGRGCLAGPIFAAAIILDPRTPILGLADSKTLSPSMRDRLHDDIVAGALACGVAWATVKEIDERGIEWANRIVFTRAVRQLLRHVDMDRDRVLVKIDGNRPAYRLGMKQQTVVGGDQTVPEITAAGIVAKVRRDRYVLEHMHRLYPRYGFDRHKGYGTAAHLAAITRWGATPLHRRSFKLPSSAPTGRTS